MPARLITLVTAALALIAAPAEARAKAPTRPKPKPCTVKRHATLVARSATTKIFEKVTEEDDLYGPTTALYACVGTRRPRFVGLADGITKGTLRVNARYVAYGYAGTDTACTKDMPSDPVCSFRGVRSVDVRTGKERASTNTSSAESLVLTPTGWIAWVTPPDPAAMTRTVLAIDASGPAARRLATGVVDPASLTATGQTVAWTADGAPQSATLAGR